jgi:elongation factor 1-alpha
MLARSQLNQHYELHLQTFQEIIQEKDRQLRQTTQRLNDRIEELERERASVHKDDTTPPSDATTNMNHMKADLATAKAEKVEIFPPRPPAKPCTNTKPRISLAFIGHVDAGKSTVAGHLLYKCGAVDKSVIEKNEREAVGYGRNFYKYSWVLDTLRAERERGITIDISRWGMETPKYLMTLIDVPGHRDFIRNMITGTSTADVAVLVIDGSPGGFEHGWAFEGQTKEHALLAFTVGVKQLIVVINKMDACRYAETRYTELQQEVSSYLKKVGYKLDRIHFIPISGCYGDNLTERSLKMTWYKGPTLLEAMDLVDPPVRCLDKPFRLPIQEVYKIGGVGIVPVGRVETGIVHPGMNITIGPTGVISQVQSMEMHQQSLSQAVAGDHVGLHCSNIDAKEIKRGYVISNSQEDPVRACESFKAMLIVMFHPGRIHSGYTPVLNCHTCQVAARFKTLDEKMDRRTGKIIEHNPEFVKTGDACMVTIEPLKPMVVEVFDAYPSLGRFAVRDMRRTIAVGIVKSVAHKVDGSLGEGKK